MNRLADLLVSFNLALLLHGVLALGAVWFWTLRPPELRPVFQGGDISLAVTFVAVPAPTETDFAKAGAASAEQVRRQAADSGNRKLETAEILTDPETEMPDDSLPADLSAEAPTSWRVGAKGEAPGTKEERQAPDSITEPLPEENEDRNMHDAETAAPASAQASADAFRQGVSGSVRMKSEIRPYYPLGARLRGEEGAVTLRVWVNDSGRARRCEVVRSSGYPALDQSAVDAARRARYVSTQPGAWRAETETTLTFRFKLTE